ncbi:hypothetical protein D3C86_1770990 [compost metagenome]
MLVECFVGHRHVSTSNCLDAALLNAIERNSRLIRYPFRDALLSELAELEFRVNPGGEGTIKALVVFQWGGIAGVQKDEGFGAVDHCLKGAHQHHVHVHGYLGGLRVVVMSDAIGEFRIGVLLIQVVY